MTAHGMRRYIDDMLPGQRLTPLPTDHFEPFDLIPTDRTDPRPWPPTVPKPLPRLELRAATAPSKSSPSPADLTRPSAATRVTGLRISWRARSKTLRRVGRRADRGDVGTCAK